MTPEQKQISKDRRNMRQNFTHLISRMGSTMVCPRWTRGGFALFYEDMVDQGNVKLHHTIIKLKHPDRGLVVDNVMLKIGLSKLSSPVLPSSPPSHEPPITLPHNEPTPIQLSTYDKACDLDDKLKLMAHLIATLTTQVDEQRKEMIRLNNTLRRTNDSIGKVSMRLGGATEGIKHHITTTIDNLYLTEEDS